MFRLRTAVSRVVRQSVQKRNVLTERIDHEYYNPFTVVGTHAQPPSTAIWINRTYHFGWVIYFLQYVLKDHRFGEKYVEDRIVKHFQKHGLYPTQIVSRLKEDGCFVYFKDLDTAEKALDYIRVSPMKNDQTSYIVMGTPFFEDMVMKRPTVKLGVDLTTERTMEDLFYIFRPYGRISHIVLDEKLKKAEIVYWNKSSSIAARNCLHNSQYAEEQRLYLKYLTHNRFHKVQEYIASPKLLPLWAVLVTIVLYLLVEPIRLFSVTQTILFGKQGTRDQKRVKTPMSQKFSQRQKDVDSIKKMLEQVPDSVIVINGPKGAGKGAVIREITDHRRLAVRFDCQGDHYIGKVGDANNFIDDIERNVGYFPTFTSVNSLISYVEMMLPMKKQPLSSTKVTQLTTVLNTIQTALGMIGIGRKTSELVHFDYPVLVFNGFQELIQKMETQSKDDKDKAKSLLDLLLKWSMQNVQKRNAHIVFVVNDNSFTEEAFRQYPDFRGKIKTYHIDDISQEDVMQYLNKNIEIGAKDREQNTNKATQQVEEVVEVKRAPQIQNDSKLQLFMNIVLWRKGNEVKNVEQDQAIKTVEKPIEISDEKTRILESAYKVIGGRVNDIQSLTHRVKRGFSVQDAVDDMYNEVKDEILYGGFGDKLFVEETGKKWTQSQLWKTIKLISEKECVPYHTLLHQVFEGNQLALDSLINADILNVREKNVMSFSPLYLHTFRELSRDKAMQKGMEKLCVTVSMDKNKKKIAEIEDELVKIKKSDLSGPSIEQRKQFLDMKLADLNELLTKDEEKEREYAKIKLN